MDPRERALKISDALQEKGEEVSPDSLTAFGIAISSRYGKCYELEEMLAFCRLCADAGAATFITEVFYDTKACIVNITFQPEAVRNHTVVNAVEAIADTVFSQYCRQDGSVGGTHDTPESDL